MSLKFIEISYFLNYLDNLTELDRRINWRDAKIFIKKLNSNYLDVLTGIRIRKKNEKHNFFNTDRKLLIFKLLGKFHKEGWKDHLNLFENIGF